MKASHRGSLLVLSTTLLALSLVSVTGFAPVRVLAAESLQVPAGGGWATWQAEAAAPTGRWQTEVDPAASGGKYLEMAGDRGSLTFTFTLDRQTCVRLRPVWWRDGDRKAARRFPYPLQRLPGPDAVARCGPRVLFTAPTAGRVGFVDAGTGATEGYLTLGGYLTDLVVDDATGRAYVADALGDRVVVLDAVSRRVLGSIATPPEPWSLALGGGRLYVACRAGKCVCAIDPARRRVVETVPLDAPAISVSLAGSPPDSVVVRFAQETFTAQGLQSTAADKLQYGLGNGHRSVRWDSKKTFDSPRAGLLRIAAGTSASALDVASVTAEPRRFEPPAAFAAEGPGPGAMAACGDYVLFTAPRSGRVGIVDAKTDKLVKTLDVGGWPVDIVADAARKKAYVADVAGDRIVVLDTAKMAIAKSVKVPAEPCSLALVGSVALQRPNLVAPMQINRLFVACRAARRLAVIDVTKDALIKTLDLPAPPRRVGFVPTPNEEWWPLLSDYQIPIALTPRVAVEPEPVSVNLATLAVTPAADVAEAAPRHSTVRLGDDPKSPVARANDQLLLTLAGGKLVDVSDVADPQLAATHPLGPRDKPGTITYSVDGGPQVDWTRGIWIRPDNDVFLVAGSDEYWRWNAPSFPLRPGRHTVTVRARGGYVCLDALKAERTAAPLLSVTALPEPRSVQAQVPLSSYQGVFYNREPVEFEVRVSSVAKKPMEVRIQSRLDDYMGEQVGEGRPIQMTVRPGRTASAPLRFHPSETGHFKLTLTLKSPLGSLVREVRFVRVPKLEHPRLFFRKDDLPAIRQRMAQHPRLFQRYAAWLTRAAAHETGTYPGRFLPAGLTKPTCASAAPPGTKDPQQSYAWRMYELGFRMLAVEFAAQFIPGADRTALQRDLAPLLHEPTTSTWVEYHHHGPFFPGAVAGMVDMAPDSVRKSLPIMKFFERYKGNMNVYPWTLLTIEEPITPRDRALIYKMAIMHTNFERYFEAHTGTRGGTWWQNPWSWCYCPTQGIFLSFLFTSNFLGEPRIFEKKFFRAYLTFMEYADPISDKRNLLPEHFKPSGEPWRWILTAACRHPEQKAVYPWDNWVKKLDGPLPGDQRQAVDDLFNLKGMPMSGPLVAAPNYFTTGVSVPMALAMGWYDPKAPVVQKAEQPPTTLFNVDGLAAMRSGWDKNATEVEFFCGVRDHTARQEPGQFTVVKAGEFLFGSPALWADDGNCTPAWGNTVVFGNKWLGRWQMNLEHPRAAEYAVIDRFSPMTWTYIDRDRRLCGYAPAESGWGGGIDLHGHTETLLVKEARIIGYQTRPQYDYVAGDATDAWPTDEARYHYRQIVFLKPDTLVVYDRAGLGPAVKTSRWIAATGPELSVGRSSFRVGAGDEAMRGEVLLPREAVVSAPALPPYYQWKGQKMLQIAPAHQAREMEYLVVLTVGGRDVAAPKAHVAVHGDMVEVTIDGPGRPAVVRFRRTGAVGGSVSLAGEKAGGEARTYALPQKIDDTYAYWSSDPRFAEWTGQPRFSYVVPPCDRKYEAR